MERQTLSQITPTPINQGNIIQLTPPNAPTWMQMAKRLYNDGHKNFRTVCYIARITAQKVAVPTDDSFFALIDNMASLKKSPFWLNYAIDEIEKVYNEAYFLSNRADSSNQGDVIPFPMSVQGGAK